MPRLQQSRHDTDAFSLLVETARVGLVKGGAGVPSRPAQNLVNARLKGC